MSKGRRPRSRRALSFSRGEQRWLKSNVRQEVVREYLGTSNARVKRFKTAHQGIRAQVEAHLTTSGLTGTGGPTPGNTFQAAAGAASAIANGFDAMPCPVTPLMAIHGNFTYAAFIEGNVGDPLKFKLAWERVAKRLLYDYAKDLVYTGLNLDRNFYVFVGFEIPEEIDFLKLGTAFALNSAKPVYLHIGTDWKTAPGICDDLGLHCERHHGYESELRPALRIAENMKQSQESLEPAY